MRLFACTASHVLADNGADYGLLRETGTPTETVDARLARGGPNTFNYFRVFRRHAALLVGAIEELCPLLAPYRLTYSRVQPGVVFEGHAPIDGSAIEDPAQRLQHRFVAGIA